jgi:hypothetical protein
MSAKKRKVNVVILDDETNVEAAIVAKLPKALGRSATSIKPDQISSMIKELGDRAAAVRSSKKYTAKPLPIDGADLFIVDYDLVKAKNEDYLTGETVAYLARCYSQCGVIVALNQFCRQPTFDLTLRPTLDSFADINVATADLKNNGLWSAASWKGYRPWSWPALPDLIEQLARRVQDVKKADLKRRVVDFLDFPQSVVERLPTAALELLGSQQAKAEAATLADVLRSPVLGLRGKEATERKAQPEQDARIVAARLSAWLNFILAPQDVIVDAPHLAQRCPSLIASKPTAASLTSTGVIGSDINVFQSKTLEKTRFGKHYWFDRPVWFWTEIERLRLTQEVKDPWHSVNDRFVFCEDVSSFKPRTSSKTFQSDLISPYRTRFVSRVSGIEYQPAHRLALA